MDPELKAYLDAMRAEADARDAETRRSLRAEIATVGTIASAALQAATEARQTAETAATVAEEGRREARVLHEATMTAIGTVIEAVNTLRDSVERRAEDRERALTDRHIAPLETAARVANERHADHERRITVLEEHRQKNR